MIKTKSPEYSSNIEICQKTMPGKYIGRVKIKGYLCRVTTKNSQTSKQKKTEQNFVPCACLYVFTFFRLIKIRVLPSNFGSVYTVYIYGSW